MAVLQANSRPNLKKSVTKKIRKEGNVPAVLYGEKLESQSVSVNGIDFLKTVRDVGRNGLISLEVDGKKHKVMVYDLQIDPLKNEYTHIDFFEVNMSTEIDANVHIRLVGESPGEKEGGIVSQLLHEVGVRCLPSDIPEEIEVNISNLAIGDSIQVADLRSSVSVELTSEDEETIVTVQAPAASIEPEQLPETEEATE
ncbi:50S ribosomal protein L25/general stress protein Ctc [bacterium LRH843]|nr:50S ribosomal protein L25/general stress protein Ctc [bacterium LRH843]